MSEDPVVILSAEHFGVAVTKDGVLDIGGVKVPYSEHGGTVHVYVRRSSSDLSIIEICVARHDGLAQEELNRENGEAEDHPLGAKEYWRSKMVGHYTTGADGHVMTDADFESEWDET